MSGDDEQRERPGDESELPALPLEGEIPEEREAEPLPELPGDRYETVSRLGRGAFGEVFRARDRVLGRDVAVKRIRLDAFVETAQLEEVKRRFLREAQVAAQLRHPNIVTTHDIVSSPTSSFIVMELVEGDTLQTTLQARGRLPLAEALAVLSQVASALDHAHAAGVIHRDVKPGNVMIEPSGHVKVMDFGIARLDAGADLTATGLILGTPSYMSPEQARGEKVDGRADVFSLGCVLYECVTGEKPFRGDQLTAILVKVLTEAPAPLDAEGLGLPSALDSVLRRAVSKEPSARFGSPGELVAAAVAAADGTPAEAPAREGSGTVVATAPAVPSEETAPSALALPHRHRLVPLAAGVLAIGVLAAGVFGVGRWRDAGEEGPRLAGEGGGLVVEEELGLLDLLLGQEARLLVTLPAATRLEVELKASISSADAAPGERFVAELRAPVRIEGVEALGDGARVVGHVAHVASAEAGKGQGELTLELDSVTLIEGGRKELETAPVVLRAPAPAKKKKKGLRGRIEDVGAAVGGLLGRGKGRGATMGGVDGASLAYGDHGIDVVVSPGNAVRVPLTAPLTVAVVSEP